MSRAEIGQRVTTRRIGMPLVGTAQGFVKAEPYASRTFPSFDFGEWNQHYPNWKDGYLTFVMLDRPDKCDCTGEETWTLVYPEDDLEVFDDAFAEGLGSSLLTRQER